MTHTNFYKNKTILITGSTGFKWSWLAFWLYSLWANVIWYSLIPVTNPSCFAVLKIEEKITQIYWDLNNSDLLNQTIEKYKPEIIFHLAAQALVKESYLNPVETYKSNVMWTISVLESIRTHSCITWAVLITTDKVYENIEKDYAYKESDKLWGHDPYSSSKAMCELAISSYYNSFLKGLGKKIVSVRAWNVIWWGDWSKDRLLPDIVKSVEKGQSIHIRNPDSVRPWQYVLEALYGYLLIWEKIYEDDLYLWSYNFWPNKQGNLKVIDLVKESIRILEKWSYILESDTSNQHEANLLLLDNSKAKRILWWDPKYNIDETLERTLHWYKNYYEWWNIEELSLREIQNFNI